MQYVSKSMPIEFFIRQLQILTNSWTAITPLWHCQHSLVLILKITFFFLFLNLTTQHFHILLSFKKDSEQYIFFYFLNSFNCFIHRRMRQLKILLHSTLKWIKYMSNGVKSFEPSRQQRWKTPSDSTCVLNITEYSKWLCCEKMAEFSIKVTELCKKISHFYLYEWYSVFLILNVYLLQKKYLQLFLFI